MNKVLNKKDIRYAQNLVIIILILKIIGIMFVKHYAETGKTWEGGTIFRERNIIQQTEISPVMLALGYHWDSIHYVNTSVYWKEHFKAAGQLRNFGYLYPAAISLVTKLTKSSITSAVLISNLFSIFVILAFYAVCRLYLNEDESFNASVILAVYPPFFASGLIAYSEPLFLFFAVMAWYFFAKEKFFYWGICASLCLITRTSGIILIPIYFIIITMESAIKSIKEEKLRLPKLNCLWLLLPIGVLAIQTVYTANLTREIGIRTESFSGMMPTVNNHYLPITLPIEQIRFYLKEINVGLDMTIYILPIFILGFLSKSLSPALSVYSTIAVLAVISISHPEVIRAVPRHLLNGWTAFIITGKYITGIPFLLILSSILFLAGLKTLDYYFVVSYI